MCTSTLSLHQHELNLMTWRDAESSRGRETRRRPEGAPVFKKPDICMAFGLEMPFLCSCLQRHQNAQYNGALGVGRDFRCVKG